MKKLFIPILIGCLSFSFTILPSVQTNYSGYLTGAYITNKKPVSAIEFEAISLYDCMGLKQYGLSKEAFTCAFKGYQRLMDKKMIGKSAYLTICDFSQSSKQKRLYIIDIANDKLELNTYVAHGRNSGSEYATKFSNRPESLQSSLGFYITQGIYIGEHGPSLKIDGVEPGINDRALQRNIVIHGADYIDENWLRRGGCMGRSFGCPAVPEKECDQIINTIKNGTCLFIYNPAKQYLQHSKILND